MDEKVLAWHFVAGRELRDGQRLRRGLYRLPEGVKPVMCRVGFHASRRPLDALFYAPGPVVFVCRVELSGRVIEHTDKLVASECRVLWYADATSELYRFAVWCAERALRRERAAGREPDARSWGVLNVTRRWIAGEASGGELGAAAWAVRRAVHAVKEAAYAAAEAAGYSAQAAEYAAQAARAAALAAAEAAGLPAELAAYAAADASAESAGYAAALRAAGDPYREDRAWTAAEVAVQAAQNRRLTRLLLALGP